ncbi:MAG: hypothetical protein OEY66_08130 [Gammaproteobacteria bacterium]|nr:hypothetical protein [Gammaproteobacteria bacterium]
MKRLIKIFCLILATAGFVPVSCTTGMVIGQKIIKKLDDRYVSKGDKVHSFFIVVAEPGELNNPFQVIGLSQLETLTNNAGSLSFMMSKPSGKIETESISYSYEILSDTVSEQIIEVIEDQKDGDRTSWSRYRATQDKITPISSRMIYFGYMFNAFPYAFGIALALYFFGRTLSTKISLSDKKSSLH